MKIFLWLTLFMIYWWTPVKASPVMFVSVPSTQNVTEGSTATFNCTGYSQSYYWLIDGRLPGHSSNDNRGLKINDRAIDGGSHLNEHLLQIPALQINNGLSIQCFIYTLGVIYSDVAYLNIQGILDGVGDLMATVIDGSNVSLTWTPPYSLDNVPITGYNIITSDGINITVNTPYHILTSSDPDPCNITTVSVGAINDVGTSQYNNVSFHYQTAPPQSYEVVSITNGSRHGITVVVDLSSLCVGEHPNSITINVIYSNDIVYTTDISSISMDGLAIRHNITLQNDWIEYFTVNVTLSNRGGETSYPFPLGHLGPVNNITSSSTNCSIINVSWNRSPSVHDRVNIHNYTLRRYNDNELVSSVTINGNTTSYEFVDEELFSHEYKYEICGNNELGEGNCSNGTFSYLRVSRSVRNNTTLTLLNDTILYFNIPIIFDCAQILPVNANVTIYCDNALVYTIGRTIDTLSVSISDNMTIVPSQYESCHLNVTLNNTNGGISTTFMKELTLVNPTATPTISPSSNPPLSLGAIIGIVVGVVGVSAGFLLGICVTVVTVGICYYYKKKVFSRKVAVTNTPVDNSPRHPRHISNEQASSIITHSESADLLNHQHDNNANIDTSVKKLSVVPGVIYESVQVAKERPIALPSAVDPVIYSDIDHTRQAPPHPHANRPMSTVTVLPSGVSDDTPPAIPAKRRQDKPSSSDDIPLLPGQVNSNTTTTNNITDDNTTIGPTLNTYL